MRVIAHAPVAQLDRASGFEPAGRRFKSCRAHQASFTFVGSSEDNIVHRRMTQWPLLMLGLALLCAGCSYQYRWAAVDGDTPALVAQLNEGLDVNTRTTLLGTRLLTLAAAHGHLDTVQALLDRKADVNAADATGWTPLHAAAYGGKPEIIRLLLDRGATAPPPNWYTRTPVEVAEMLGHKDAVDLLKKASQAKDRR